MESWAAPDESRVEVAKEKTRAALYDANVVDRLAPYYSVDDNYVGATFAELQPIEPYQMVSADLHAVRIMRAPIEARATRRLLGSHHPEIRSALTAIEVSETLEFAEQRVFCAMETLFEAVRVAIGGENPWVTASKLCARKRPALFPVRDDKVCRYLELLTEDHRNYWRTDWQVFQALLLDGNIVQRIDQLAAEVQEWDPRRLTVRVDMYRLHVLDAALWMTATGK